MIKLKEHCVDMFTVVGRGLILAINRKDYPGHIFNAGDIVEYQSKQYEVTMLELYWKLCYPPILGDNVGLVVKEN